MLCQGKPRVQYSAMSSKGSIRRSQRPVDRRRSPLRTPRARPIKLGRFPRILQRRGRRELARYSAAVDAHRAHLLQGVASASEQFADAKQRGKPLGIYADRLARAQHRAQESDVIIRASDVQQAKREGVGDSRRKTARATITRIKNRLGKGWGGGGHVKGTRRRRKTQRGRARRRRKTLRRRARRRSR